VEKKKDLEKDDYEGESNENLKSQKKTLMKTLKVK